MRRTSLAILEHGGGRGGWACEQLMPEPAYPLNLNIFLSFEQYSLYNIHLHLVYSLTDSEGLFQGTH